MLLRILILSFLLCAISCKNSKSQNLDVFSQMSSQLYCGSAPSLETHFSYLESAGIRSIISVDGAKPNLKLARKYGLAYVHIPYGYDRIELAQQMKLTKAYDTLPKPVYIHCHHGRHRAPVGGAIILRNHFSEPPAELINLVESLGTSKAYKGLYQSIKDSQVLDKKDWSGYKLKEYEASSDLAERMAGMDRLWDQVKTNEVFEEREHSRLLLEEDFFELARAEQNLDLKEKYMELHRQLNFLKQALKKKSEEVVQSRIKTISGLCKDCHRKIRD